MRKAGERDYRDGTLRDEKGKPQRKPADTRRLPDGSQRWWTLKGKECADAIRSTVAFLQKNQTARTRQAVVNGRLYGNIALSGSAGSQYARVLQQQAAIRDRITYNVIAENIDTLVSRVGEEKPRPYFLTSGGNYRQQRKAKKLNQGVEGIFYENKTYDLGLEAFRDGAIQGDGFVHVWGWGGKVRHEVVPGVELWVDDVEARYGRPRRLYWVKDVDRDELAAAFPEARAAIMGASRSTTQGPVTNIADAVTVVEAWNLPNLDEKTGEPEGGCHAIALHSNTGDVAMLVEPEEWPHDFFPFARIPWSKRPTGQGFWSQGLAEQLQGDQMELNKTLWLIQRSMHLAGAFKLLLHNGSKVVTEHINNEVGAILKWSGQVAPQYITVAPIDRIYIENVQEIIARARQRAGNSQMSTGGTKPAGLDSGKALREQQDIESDRHRTTQRNNNNLYLELAHMSVAIAQELAREGKMQPVRVPGKRTFQTIDWKKDIGSLKNSEFVMQCFPVSKLPRDPAGRLQTIQEYIQAGFITPRQGRILLDFPDIESIDSLASAQEEILTKTLDDIIDDGVYAPPEPTDDLSLAKEMVLEYIQRYRLLELEDEKLDMLRTWSSQVDQLQQLAQAAMAPPPGAVPQAAPEAPPTSDLIPNAPAGAQPAAA